MARSTPTGQEEDDRMPHERWPPTPADHPIFKRGFVIGMKRTGSSSTPGATPRPASPLPDPETDNLLPEPGSAPAQAPEALPAETNEEGQAESEAFARHREAQRRPRPVDPV